MFNALLEVKDPYDPVCPSFGRLVVRTVLISLGRAGSFTSMIRSEQILLPQFSLHHDLRHLRDTLQRVHHRLLPLRSLLLGQLPS